MEPPHGSPAPVRASAPGWRRDLAGRGAAVILSGRDESRLAEVAADLPTESLILPFDVRDDDALAAATAAAIAWRGGVDLAVANAGISQRSIALQTSMAVYRQIIEVDLIAQIAFAQGLIGHMAGARQRPPGLRVVDRRQGGGARAHCVLRSQVRVGRLCRRCRQNCRRPVCTCTSSTPARWPRMSAAGALTADGSTRGKSGAAIDQGIPADEAAASMVDAMLAGQRRSSSPGEWRRRWARCAALPMPCWTRWRRWWPATSSGWRPTAEPPPHPVTLRRSGG